MRVVTVSFVVVVLAGSGAMRAAAQTTASAPPAADCCRHEELAEKYSVIWTGMSQTMTIERLAAYAAPVLWFSPDEPLLKLRRKQGSARGKEILIPEPFPFEADPGGPIVYYRVRRILQRIDEPGAGTYVENPDMRGDSLVDLAKVEASSSTSSSTTRRTSAAARTSTTSSPWRPGSPWPDARTARSARGCSA